MDFELAAAVPQFRDPAGRQINEPCDGCAGATRQTQDGTDPGVCRGGVFHGRNHPALAMVTQAQSNLLTMRKLLIVAVAMFGFGFALVPFY